MNEMLASFAAQLQAPFVHRALIAGVLIALTANNEEAQSFYKSVENASMHDTGIWIDLQ